MSTARKVRSDKKTRVGPPLDQDTHELLCRLALACGITKTALAAQIISIAVNTDEFVHFLQDKNGASTFRIITVRAGDKLKYIDGSN